MKTLQRILLLKADHQPADDALEAAVRLARRSDAELTFADLLPDGDAISDFFRGEHRRQLRELIAGHANDVDVAFRLLAGTPATALAPLGDAYDLIFPAGGSDRFLADLLRSSPLPVWVAGAGAVPPRRILATVDVDDESSRKERINRAVLEGALALGRHLGAEVEVASVWTPPGPASRLASSRALQRRARQAGERVDAMLAEALDAMPSPGGRPPIHLAGGNPAELLAETAAARDVDLVVAGHSGRTGLPAWLIGNTAERLLRRVACSLLALPEPAAAESARAA